MRGTLITFYSYKGGVGRTLALANVGALLSFWGYRVLCIDWDLEAPGLHRYFDRWLSASYAEGLVELITEHGAGEETERDDFVDAARNLDSVDWVGSSRAESGAAAESMDFAAESALHKAYLARVVAQTQSLSLAGIDPSITGTERTSWLGLEAVYTPLLTINPDEGRFSAQRSSAVTQLNHHARLVLLGDPGSGKTMFAKFVALCMAGEALELPEANLRRLGAPVSDSSAENGETWDHGALLPVWVSLRDFAARGLPAPGVRATAQNLWSFIEGTLSDAGLAEYAPLLRRRLLSQGGLFILDGLDEVPEAQSRREQARQAIESLVLTFGQCRFLVTCRTYAYRNQAWRLAGFDEAVLAPFGESQIDQFIHRWYAQVAALGRLDAASAAGRAGLLLQAIFSSSRLQELAQRPLLLSLMASLHGWRGGSLPERREELYSNVVELLLDTWERQRMRLDSRGEPLQPDSSIAEWLRVDRHEVRQVLEELAFETHIAQPDLSGTADLDEGRLVARLLHLSRNPGANAGQLVAYLRDRSGLLVERGNGVYSFPHRVFQEYLAACYLTGESFPDQLAELARVDPLRWREVALLAGARAARGTAATVWYLADALCWREPDDPAAGVEDLWGSLIASQLVAESADLRRVSPRDLPKLDRFRRWLVRLLREDRLPAAERALAGHTLAVLGDPRSEVMTLDGMEFRFVPAGPFRMGSGDEDSQALENEKPQHQVDLPYEYRIARYPVTVAQFREYMEAGGAEGYAERLHGAENGPAVGVSWNEAMAFCDWLTRRWHLSGRLESGWRILLPSEAEWEKAARGTDGRRYSWGQEVDPDLANYVATGIGDASPVGCFPRGASPFGCEEMCGNVWEWMRSLWGRRWHEPDFAYPYSPGDGREDLAASQGALRILRGGSYINSSRDIRCSSRTGLPPESRNDGTGFRVVLIPATSAYSQ